MENLLESISKEFKFKISGKEYSIGDIIEFERPVLRDGKDQCRGEILFETYEDDEGYNDKEHLGIFIKYKYCPWEDNREYTKECQITFPDFISLINNGFYKLI
jgi:hypothetical protein